MGYSNPTFVKPKTEEINYTNNSTVSQVSTGTDNAIKQSANAVSSQIIERGCDDDSSELNLYYSPLTTMISSESSWMQKNNQVQINKQEATHEETLVETYEGKKIETDEEDSEEMHEEKTIETGEEEPVEIHEEDPEDTNEEKTVETREEEPENTQEDKLAEIHEAKLDKLRENLLKEILEKKEEKKTAGSDDGFVISENVLVKYEGAAKFIVVPENIKVIGKEAFSHNDRIEEVILPDGIVIEEGGFSFCQNLSSLSRKGKPVIVRKIGKSSFHGCSLLNAPIIFEGSILSENAFYGCKSLERVTLNQNVDIRENAFRFCDNLVNICGNSGAWNAGRLASGVFWGCNKLRSVIKISEKIVHSHSFCSCKSIKQIILPKYAEIKENAFKDCENLEMFSYRDEILPLGSVEKGSFHGCRNLQTKFRLMNNIIPEYAFCHCNRVNVIEIPDKAVVCEHAFEDCRNLTTIKNGYGSLELGRLEKNAFFGCKRLNTKIKLTNRHIPDYAFSNCKMLEELDLGNGTDIGAYAFENCESLKTISNFREIFTAGKLMDGAFCGCVSLSDYIKITEDVVRKDVFQNCKKLRSVFLPAKNNIEEDAFELCDAKRLKYSDIPVAEKRDIGPKSNKNEEEIEYKEDNIIRFKDFVVKTEVFGCRRRGHDLKEVTAIVFCLTKDGRVVEKKIMAGYCRDCKRYYILEREFEHLKTNYRLLCRVIDNKLLTSKGSGVFSDFNQESIIKQYGYTVNQQDGLTSAQRQKILELIVGAKILTKPEICAHLDWLIKSRSSTDSIKYRNAIKKWTEDRDHISHYRITDNQRVIVNQITRGKERSLKAEEESKARIIPKDRIAESIGNSVTKEDERKLPKCQSATINKLTVAKHSSNDAVEKTEFNEVIIGLRVRHRSKGYGIIKACDGENISIEFSNGKVLDFSMEDAFSKGMIQFM